MTPWKSAVFVGLAVGLVVGTAITLNLGPSAHAQADKGTAGGPRYSVVETEAHNLIVTDNKTNILYFYTIDKDQPIGSDLKLRGSLDLKQVGKAVLHPVKAKAE